MAIQPEHMKRAAAYYRRSTDKQEQSIGDQRTEEVYSRFDLRQVDELPSTGLLSMQ